MSAVPAMPALDNTMGALYLGVVLAMGLWGAGTVQVYYYFNAYPKDPWQLKTHVVTVWVFDTVHQALVTHACYIYLITQYGNPLYLTVIVPSLEVMVLISGFVCLLVQSFLVYRVWRLSANNVPLVACLFLFVVAEFIANTSFFGKGVQMASFADVPTIAWLSKLSNGLSAATDVVIAASLTFLLNRSRTGFRKSETMINRLILFTINTGMLTSVCAIVTVIFVSLYPDNLIYVTTYLCISKLYTNTLLATLNARRATRDGAAADSNEQTSLSMGTFARSAEVNSNGTGRAFAIRVDTETAHVDDEGFNKLPPRSIPDSENENSFPYSGKRDFLPT
ncbi:hypothetical protein DFH11DRAFT_1733223 [Phellopilus nigrolimitatus]|nr:hypothetical protein DFH11DRAFT_1733223 [Phellopilus nigrolimitatus]